MQYINSTLLEPLFEQVEVHAAQGRFKVQLEVPPKSTLTTSEIEKLLAMSSWDVDPLQAADRAEGGRSVVFNRAASIEKNGISLGGLQLSGVGFRPIKFSAEAIGLVPVSIFLPPTNQNFMDLVPPNCMHTSYAIDLIIPTITHTAPTYRANGAYTYPELLEKLTGTELVDSLQLEQMVVPHVEAYGRFVEDALCTQDGNFGFMVFPVPRASIERVGSLTRFEIRDERTTLMSYKPPALEELMWGLCEVHDQGVSHLQPHPGNYYLIDGKVYLVDWGTIRPLKAQHHTNLLNRAFDITTPLSYLIYEINLFRRDTPKQIIISAVQTLTYYSLFQYVGDQNALSSAFPGTLFETDTIPRVIQIAGILDKAGI